MLRCCKEALAAKLTISSDPQGRSMQDLDRSAWVQIFVILLLFMILDGCGDHQRSKRKQLLAQQEFTRALDSPGKRVVFRDQYDQRLGKWRTRKHKTRVYDADLSPQGDIIAQEAARLSSRAPSVGDVLYEAHLLDGSQRRLSLVASTPERGLYALGEAFEVEHQQERWTLFHKEPYRRPVARIFLSGKVGEPIRVQELQTELGTVERLISSDPSSSFAVVKSPGAEGGSPDAKWRGPGGVSPAMMAPFVLRHVQWSSLEQSMFALLLDAAHRAALPEADGPHENLSNKTKEPAM